VRVLKKQDPAFLKKYDLSSLRALFLAGEPLDEPTAKWIAESLGRPIIDNYWQTESGWPILTVANGVEKKASKFGSPGVPMYGYDVKLVHESTGEELKGPDQKGVVVIEGPTPPGFMQTVWRDDARYVNTYWSSIRAGRCTAPSTGASATRTATTTSWAARRRDQRGRPPPGHARDRGEHLLASQHRRSRGGGRGDQLKGQVASPSPSSRTPRG
jgi:acyl-coenzyme A synthetase/AMP-(fatty) acid ligase